MKRIKIVALILVVAMVFSVSAAAIDAPKIGDDFKGKVVIIHTNDTHGSDVAVAGKSIGTAGIAQLRNDYEAAGAEVILVSAGDATQGAPLVNLSNGASAMNFMALAGYDLMVPGNHEFDWGTKNLLTLEKLAKFKFLSANIYDSEKNEPLFETRTTFNTKIGKIGIFGLTTPETATKAHPDKVSGTTFHSGAKLYSDARAQVDALKRESCAYIICVSHLGDDASSAPNRSIDVAENVPGIDIIIDGHSHSVLDGSNAANKHGSTLIVSAGEKSEYAGVIFLDRNSYTAGLIPATKYSLADADVANAIKNVNDGVEAQLSAVFAKSEVLLDGEREPGVRTKETNLGDFAADALLWGASYALGEGKVDAALTNGGGIRASIAAGSITMKDMATVFPYSNTIATVELTGSQLLEALEAATFCSPATLGAFPQVSGIEFTIKAAVPYVNGTKYSDSTYYAPAKPGSRILGVKVGGEPLDLKKTYTIATNDFTASGGDTYGVFKSCKTYDTGLTLEDALVAYTSEVLKGVVTKTKYGKPAGRITVDLCPLDVSKAAWYYDEVITVIESGFMSGVGSGNFAPGGDVSRAMVAQSLYNAEGKPEVLEKASFNDIPADAWYADAAAWTEDNGLFAGTDKGFEGNRKITRQELCKVIVSYCEFKNTNLTKGDLSSFTDKDKVASWASDYVSLAVGSKLISGMGGNALAPTGTANRAQLAAIFTNYLTLVS